MAPDPTERAVIELERAHPEHQVWTVHTWNGHQRGVTWCARRRDGTGHVLNAHSAAELSEYLASADNPDPAA